MVNYIIIHCHDHMAVQSVPITTNFNMHVWFPVKKSLFRIAGISYFNTTVMSLLGPLIWTNKILNWTNVVSSNPSHGKVYLMQHYVIKFVSDLRQVSYILRVLGFPPPIKLTATIQWNIVESGSKHLTLTLDVPLYMYKGTTTAKGQLLVLQNK